MCEVLRRMPGTEGILSHVTWNYICSRISVCIVILVEMPSVGLEHRSKLQRGWINSGFICM